jgi:hypothetical protein
VFRHENRRSFGDDRAASKLLDVDGLRWPFPPTAPGTTRGMASAATRTRTVLDASRPGAPGRSAERAARLAPITPGFS